MKRLETKLIQSAWKALGDTILKLKTPDYVWRAFIKILKEATDEAHNDAPEIEGYPRAISYPSEAKYYSMKYIVDFINKDKPEPILERCIFDDTSLYLAYGLSLEKSVHHWYKVNKAAINKIVCWEYFSLIAPVKTSSSRNFKEEYDYVIKHKFPQHVIDHCYKRLPTEETSIKLKR